MFINAIKNEDIKGCLIRMGHSSETIFRKSSVAINYNMCNYLNDDDAKKAWKEPTNLKAFDACLFDLIARHGYECTDATLTTYRKDISNKSMLWPGI